MVMTDLSSKMKILGKPAFIDRINILHNQRIGRVKFLNSDVSPKFIYYYLRTKAFSEEIKATATGTMVRHTAPTRILACQMPLLSLERQAELIKTLDVTQAKCVKLRRDYESRMLEFANLRQSLLQKAFSGELT